MYDNIIAIRSKQMLHMPFCFTAQEVSRADLRYGILGGPSQSHNFYEIGLSGENGKIVDYRYFEK